MMTMNQHEIEQRLQISLMSYGLNPNEWLLQNKCFANGLQKIELVNKTENQVKLVGKALIKKCGHQMIAVWRSMSLSNTSF